jgi:hypothetical protein
MKQTFKILQTGLLMAGLAAAQADPTREPTTPTTPGAADTMSPSYPNNSERQNNYGWLGLLGLAGLSGLFRRDSNRVNRAADTVGNRTLL